MKIKPSNPSKPDSTEHKYYLKVRANSQKWDIFNNSFASKIAKSGIYISFKKGHKSSILKKLTKSPFARRLSKNQIIKIEVEIKSLIKLGILSINDKDKIFPNHIFIITSDHRTTKDRLIFDMSSLNKSINRKKFTLTKMNEIIPHIYENQYACSFDLKKAYYHVPINPKYHKYFSFRFKDVNYSFNAMPFGLSTAPYLFTKFISPILEHLRAKHNIIIFAYLDDFLLLGNSQTDLSIALDTTIQLFESLGFLINREKSTLVPVQFIQFLGIEFDLKNKTMNNTERLIQKTINSSLQLIKETQITRNQLERFIGLANFMSYQMPNGRHHLHPIIKITNSFFPINQRYSKFPNRVELQDHLLYWTKINHFAPVRISNILPEITIEVDSSSHSWGATLIQNHSSTNFQGVWSTSEKEKHINTKELLGVLRALESLPKEIRDSHLALNNDNKTTVSTLSKLGSNRSAVRQKITSQILQELTRRNCTFEIHHIPGQQMVLADFLSRNTHLMPTELQISPVAFQRTTKKLELNPEIDLFATKFNAKLKIYHSSIQDQKAAQINTFTTDWSNYKVLYAFPPPNLIHKVIYKWKREKNGQLILLAPNWPTKNWYSPLQRITIKKIPLLLNQEDLFIRVKTGKQIIQPSKFHLHAHIL